MVTLSLSNDALVTAAIADVLTMRGCCATSQLSTAVEHVES
jgi:hypothetical protein